MKNPFIKIGNRKVGIDYDPLVIAEIGINHGGSLEVAKEMVDAANESGAEVIKHQTHIIEDEMSKSAKNIKPGNSNRSIFDIMNDVALNEKDELELKEYVESKGMTFISTPFSRKAFLRLERFGVDSYKIGSGECNNYPLIELIASTSKPIILSTGMNSIESIAKAVKIIEEKNCPYVLLHCTNLYPTPHDLVRLNGITELRENFPDAIVGLSDHTVDNLACIGAVALGASVLERHFTDHKLRVGPDIVCSMDTSELKELIKYSKIMKDLRGGKKKPLKEEQVTMDFAFASVVSISKIKKNEIFTNENIWVKRPGIGELSAEKYKDILGMKASRDIDSDEHLKLTDITK
jgi:sialic acid synthase SpsE